MSDKSTPTLGKLLEADQPRDAIHIAIAPVVAVDKVFPGQQIGFVKEGDFENVRVTATAAPIGIADPFLTQPVFPGQRFWMFLFPNTITSLRHDWTHPAFESTGSVAAGSLVSADFWMKDFAKRVHLSYDEVIQAGREYLRTGAVFVQRDSQSARDAFYEERKQYWDNFQIITGNTVSTEEREEGTPFCCNC